MLFSHVHVSGGVGGIFFTAVIQTWEFFLEFLGASPDVLLTLVLPPGVSHLNILYQVVHKHVSLVLGTLYVHSLGLRNRCTLLLFEVIVLNRVDISWTYAKLRHIRNLERLKYLFRLLIVLTPGTRNNYLVVEVALVFITGLWGALLRSFHAGLVRAISLHELGNELFANLGSALVSQDASINVIPVLVWNHVGKVTVFHWLVQF